jgi:hypothetical protein
MPRTKNYNRREIIGRNRVIAKAKADAGQTVDGEQLEPYRPARGKPEFVPRNQRNTVLDADGRMVNREELHDELRRLNP